ncbi:DUF1049 domain-containing protein [Frankia sp. CNm7]|uniref:DUF1049 domain-containing protein n=1 Tax=Frankia nepalensis TaxID=1836974 RepID=A0A937UQ60_9ACTN|nr:lipopolysaccharide assembly protein LapA domain-containing protein [Frankia nepalensis]MBL7497798.1 DUF1049 domain-containing protein [Frankia nepalensis]MBL7511301.1 DUF1049 domain-containing protein [Frankia nepalensis]MBL7517678.1 DUF1049 domain-containing protein [Frankia nepalensis]MBL7629867.1 DUF1049 domain-containing protein [Frankia nepalensis]
MAAPEQSTGKFDYDRPGHPGSGHVPAPAGAPVEPAGTGPQPPGKRRHGVSWVVYAATVAVLVLAILVIVFVIKNDQPVNVWLFGTTKRMSVAGALSMAALAGLVVGLLIGLIPQVGLRRRLRAARRQHDD